MKSVSIAAQSIVLGHNNVVVAGGMDMSMSPHYLNLKRAKIWRGKIKRRYGNRWINGSFHNKLMGVYAEATAKNMESQEKIKNYCRESYLKSQNAWRKDFSIMKFVK